MPDQQLYVAEVIEGLEFIVRDELLRRVINVHIVPNSLNGEVEFSCKLNDPTLAELRSAQAVYHKLRFSVPRPKALLGDQNFRRLVAAIASVLAAKPKDTFRTLGIAAAGSDSSVMRRLRDTLAQAAHLAPVDDKGDLLLRLRPDYAGGWEALIRISPRPLSTRSWRVRNFDASLNATVAHALVQLTQPSANDIFVNLCAGSGSIIIERLLASKPQAVLGFDRNIGVLSFATANLEAAGLSSPEQYLTLADVTRLPIKNGVANALAADLPFGQRSGSHDENARLYPALFAESARIAAVGAHFAVLTHEVRLMDHLIPTFDSWRLIKAFRITLRGLHPRIYLFQRI